MKTVKVNKKSWHYWLADIGGFVEWKDNDICTYRSAVIKGMGEISFLALIASLVFGLGAVIIGDLIGWGIACFIYGVFIQPSQYALSALIVLGIAALASSFFGVVVGGKLIINSHKPEFITTAYQSWRDKVCHKIEIVE